ncbi:hypothetical protein SmJEL517_g00154 [Synchytrium microbalum]|uniref:Ubiquitin-conjugating enzyme E2C-binding protein n=1 Tax=Synchytrium microbalum TaxID=1806994 RepID=A0A507CKD0_9FUNG|nr:uncharacterized protein SmJEL517_g00154 [Synchytrium microbalum]TPX38365.1 hypothetical protein SmJEL517_g00154 [Synchytrium microbalum]
MTVAAETEPSSSVIKSTVYLSSKSLPTTTNLVNVHLEVLPRLRTATFFVSTPNPDVISIQDTILTIDGCKIFLPVSISKRSRTSTSVEGVDITASVADTDELACTVDSPYTASSLKKLSRITCHGCNSDLIVRNSKEDDTTTFRRVLDLPSSHWHEVVDCWMCHMEDYSKLITPNGWLHPKPRDLLVGGAFVVLHSLDMEIANLLHGEVSQRERWTSVLCKECLAPLGEVSNKVENEPDSPVSYKIYKYSVDFWTNSDSADPYRSFPVYLAHDLLESASSTASYRYVVWSFGLGKDEKAKPFMLLWMLNADVRVASLETQASQAIDDSVDSNDKSTSLKSRRALKVLYMDCRGSLDPDRAKISSTWLASKTAERLTFPSAQCLELLSTLDQSATVHIPASKRTLNHMNVGYLFP